jgi:hypothetical protein
MLEKIASPTVPDEERTTFDRGFETVGAGSELARPKVVSLLDRKNKK